MYVYTYIYIYIIYIIYVLISYDITLYIYIYIYTHVSVYVRRLPDGVRTSEVFTEGPQIPFLFLLHFVLSAHVLPHVAIVYYILHTFSHAS